MGKKGSWARRWCAGASAAVLGLIVLGTAAKVEAQYEAPAAQATPEVRGISATRVEQFPLGEPEVMMLWKLGRGVQNFAFGLPAEVVKNTFFESFKGDTLFAFGTGMTEGLLVGIGKGFWRVGAGVCDVVTFPAERLAPWYHPKYLPLYPF
jgi:putative exosortase-associated protein (TIGR04073 family)